MTCAESQVVQHLKHSKWGKLSLDRREQLLTCPAGHVTGWRWAPDGFHVWSLVLILSGKLHGRNGEPEVSSARTLPGTEAKATRV